MPADRCDQALSLRNTARSRQGGRGELEVVGAQVRRRGRWSWKPARSTPPAGSPFAGRRRRRCRTASRTASRSAARRRGRPAPAAMPVHARWLCASMNPCSTVAPRPPRLDGGCVAALRPLAARRRCPRCGRAGRRAEGLGRCGRGIHRHDAGPGHQQVELHRASQQGSTPSWPEPRVCPSDDCYMLTVAAATVPVQLGGAMHTPRHFVPRVPGA